MVGVATGKHSSHGNMVQIEYVNKLLKEGEMQTIRVQGKVTKEVQQTMKKLGLKSAEEKK